MAEQLTTIDRSLERPFTEVDQAQLVAEEEYAHSQATLRRWGGSLALHEVSVEQAQQRGGLEAAVYADYQSSLREMLRTDKEFRHELDIDDKREYAVIDGCARTADGRALVELIGTGRRTAEARAKWEPAFEAQAIRDAGDEIIAHRADALLPGQAMFALSLEPKRELQGQHRDTYRELGYRDGLSYVQWYAKQDDETMIAGSFSVDLSDEHIWRELLNEKGADIPPGTDPNEFIRHSITLDNTAPAHAERFARDLISEYYERRGAQTERFSVSEYISHHEAAVRQFFDFYYPSLAQANETGRNNDTMRDFAHSLLEARIRKLRPEVTQTLMRVANGQRFDSGMSKTMDSLIRYAVVEELRKGLKPYFARTNGSPAAKDTTYAASGYTRPVFIDHLQANRLLAGNVSAGVAANRDYGGCPGQVKLAGESESNELDINNPQEAYAGYGRRGGRDRSEKDVMRCVNCPKCRTYHEELRAVSGVFRCKNKSCGHTVRT